MTMHPILRLIAGTMVLISLLLTYFVHENFVWFTVFIAINLIQSSFTLWCPMITFMKRLGIKE